jgi:hypothetical protein
MEGEKKKALPTSVDQRTDVADFLSHCDITFKTEPQDDRLARLKQQELDAQDLRFRENCRYIAFLAMYIVTFLLALFVGLFGHDASTVEWARKIFAGCVVGVGGYLIRKPEK